MTKVSSISTQFLEVSSFQDLVSMPFQGETNALCWSRKRVGDFEEIVNKVERKGKITVIEPEDLVKLELSKSGQQARTILLNDFQLLQNHGASPILNLIENYERDDAFPFFPTDVYSFHVDRSPVPTDTFLCTYFGASSEIVPNSEVEQKIWIPEIRAELLKLHGGEEGFEEFLQEFFFDLHYRVLPHAQPTTLGLGQLWRLAVDHPESPVLPCVHRAPEENAGQCRLLLIC